MYYNHLNLPFTDIFVVDDVVCVCTTRPGFWIGKAGSTINKITKKINYNLEGYQTYNFKITLLEITKGSAVDISNYIKILTNY